MEKNDMVLHWCLIVLSVFKYLLWEEWHGFRKFVLKYADCHFFLVCEKCVSVKMPKRKTGQRKKAEKQKERQQGIRQSHLERPLAERPCNASMVRLRSKKLTCCYSDYQGIATHLLCFVIHSLFAPRPIRSPERIGQ